MSNQEAHAPMLVKPDVQDETIIACLRAEYGVRVDRLTFLPLGGDTATAVYRAVADDGTPYFCKLRRDPFDAIVVELPRFLSDRGVPNLIPPLPAVTAEPYTALGDFTLVLYPFVEGTSGYETELSERQWEAFGSALGQIHASVVPPALRRLLPNETYASEWRDRCQRAIERFDAEAAGDDVVSQAASFLRPRRDTILELVTRAERLASVMAARPRDVVPCHADLHPGNLLLGPDDALFLVDWDGAILAPKERDLMFIGGGQGFVNCTAQEEEERFHRGYGSARGDPVALAYYRYERCVTDLAVECERIASRTLDRRDRAQSLEIVQLFFLPDCTVERAFASDGS